MKDALYFSHDSNARNDIKIKAMRREYGAVGYAAFWIIVEMLRDSNNYMLPLKLFTYIAIDDEVAAEGFESDKFINDCINKYELFKSDSNNFWSDSLVRRMEKKNEVAEKRKAAAKARWDKVKSKQNNSNEEQEQDKSNANALQNNASVMQNDAKESKVKESKESKERKQLQQDNKINNSEEDKSESVVVDDVEGEDIVFNNPNQHLYQYYVKNMGRMITPIEIEGLDSYVEILGEDIVKYAIEKAVFQNARKFAYIKSILQSWISNGYKTKQEILDAERERDRNKASPGERTEEDVIKIINGVN